MTDIIKAVQPKSKIIQDWKPYNESIIWEIANNYFQNKGINAFSKKQSNTIPHNINTNYPNALSIAKLIKAAIERCPELDKFMVLEAGAGSGYFSMHFLNALKDLGLSKKVKLIVSDYSRKMVAEIKEKNILKDFKEGEDYELVVVDVINPEQAKTLNGDSFVFSNLIVTVMNYVFDALPLTILRRRAVAKIVDFEELNLRINLQADEKYDLLNNTNLLTNMIKDLKFSGYEISSQSELEQKYYDDFKDFYKEADVKRFIPYPYSALDAAHKLLDLTLAKGFIFSGDIPPLKNSFCQVVGNALAHEIDNEFLAYHFAKSGKFSIIQTDSIISRILLANDKETAEALNQNFEEIFVKYNLVKRYQDLREVLVKFEFKESMDCMKYILQEFEKIAGPNSLYTWIYWGNYYWTLEDYPNAIESFKKAQSLDYLDSYSLAERIKSLEKKILNT